MDGQERANSTAIDAWQRIGMRLATLRVGRIALHMAAAAQDGQLRWHFAGIVREVVRPVVLYG